MWIIISTLLSTLYIVPDAGFGLEIQIIWPNPVALEHSLRNWGGRQAQYMRRLICRNSLPQPLYKTRFRRCDPFSVAVTGHPAHYFRPNITYAKHVWYFDTLSRFQPFPR